MVWLHVHACSRSLTSLGKSRQQSDAVQLFDLWNFQHTTESSVVVGCKYLLRSFEFSFPPAPVSPATLATACAPAGFLRARGREEKTEKIREEAQGACGDGWEEASQEEAEVTFGKCGIRQKFRDVWQQDFMCK